MDVYNDTMKQKCHSYSEIDQISAQIAALEEKMKEYMGE